MRAAVYTGVGGPEIIQIVDVPRPDFGPEQALVPVPENLDPIQAAAVPEAFITASDALFTQAGLAPGERVLIHAVGSGVGTAAVQLARAAGCTVIGTARSPDKLERCAPLGLEL